MKKINYKKLFYIVLDLFFVALLAILSISTIRAFEQSNIVDQIYNDNDDTSFAHGKFFSSPLKNLEEAQSNSQKICRQVEQEGAVLLKNNNNILPLKEHSKVTLLSRSSVDIVYTGTGSSDVKVTQKETLKDCFEKQNVEVNNIMWNKYMLDTNYRISGIMENPTSSYLMSVGESDKSIYQDQKVINSFKGFNDLAIIVISRIGGEGYDLSLGNFLDGQKGYLSITEKEKEVIKVAKQYFSKTLVLINSSNPMELGFIDEFDIDACLWIGYVGQYGLDGVIDIILGKVSPSGKLPDTYVYNNKSHPSTQNIGDYVFNNLDKPKGEWDTRNNYMVELEGIYVGYKYYETRYEDCVLNAGNARSNIGSYNSIDEFNYQKEVLFPFGYGLSYSSFIDKIDDFQIDYDKKEINVRVSSQNIGNVASKNVIELYYQGEYTEFDKDNGIEKSSINLIRFAKTKELKPNEKEIIKFNVSFDELASYDRKINQAYILESGNYYFALGEDVHQALNNILSVKGYNKSNSDYITENGDSSKVFATNIEDNYIFSEGINGVIKNNLESADINYYYDDEKFRYLSRSDYESTYPKETNNLIASEKIINSLKDDFGYISKHIDEEIVLNVQNNLKVLDMRELDYNDSKWNDLLDQISLNDLATLITKGGFSTSYIKSVGNPLTYDRDGPVGIAGTQVSSKSGTLFPSQTVMAATFNEDLIFQVGSTIAEEGLFLKVIGWYAPGLNIHRSPNGGRNFEYFSEDSVLSGLLGAQEVLGAQSKGMIVNSKHFILNEQEIHRNGICVFNNEQALREVYLKPFEYVVKHTTSLGIMTSLTRIGTTWTGAHLGLITNILRREWGFKGRVITDYTSEGKSYMSIKSGLVAGTDMWLCSTDYFLKQFLEVVSNDKYLLYKAKEAAKNILYAQCKSSAMNLEPKRITKRWKIAILSIDVLTGFLAISSIVLTCLEYKKNKKNN